MSKDLTESVKYFSNERYTTHGRCNTHDRSDTHDLILETEAVVVGIRTDVCCHSGINTATLDALKPSYATLYCTYSVLFFHFSLVLSNPFKYASD